MQESRDPLMMRVWDNFKKKGVMFDNPQEALERVRSLAVTFDFHE